MATNTITRAPESTAKTILNKVPQITILFWLTKLVSTGLVNQFQISQVRFLVSKIQI